MKLTILVDRCLYTGELQLSIMQTDERGVGCGDRLHGPKYLDSDNLLSHTITESDARIIRRYLDRAFPEPAGALEHVGSIRASKGVFVPVDPALHYAGPVYRLVPSTEGASTPEHFGEAITEPICRHGHVHFPGDHCPCGCTEPEKPADTGELASSTEGDAE